MGLAGHRRPVGRFGGGACTTYGTGLAGDEPRMVLSQT